MTLFKATFITLATVAQSMKNILTKFSIRMFTAAILSCSTFILAAPININTADLPTIIENLVDVGPVKAGAIIEYREQNGPFKAAEDLLAVKGIGVKTLEKNRDNLLFVEAEAVSPVEVIVNEQPTVTVPVHPAQQETTK